MKRAFVIVGTAVGHVFFRDARDAIDALSIFEASTENSYGYEVGPFESTDVYRVRVSDEKGKYLGYLSPAAEKHPEVKDTNLIVRLRATSDTVGPVRCTVDGFVYRVSLVRYASQDYTRVQRDDFVIYYRGGMSGETAAKQAHESYSDAEPL